MAIDEKKFEQVGNIRIKEPKKKKSKKNNKDSETSLGIKIFVWVMFIAMAASFFVPLIIYFNSVINGS